MKKQLAPELKALQERIEEGRRSLAQKLHTSIDRVLEEPNRDPDDWLATAQKHLETARSTLSLGRNEVVVRALDAMQSTAARAEGLVQASHAAADAYEEHRGKTQSELKRLRQRLPVVAGELAPVEESLKLRRCSLSIAPRKKLTARQTLTARQRRCKDSQPRLRPAC